MEAVSDSALFFCVLLVVTQSKYLGQSEIFQPPVRGMRASAHAHKKTKKEHFRWREWAIRHTGSERNNG